MYKKTGVKPPLWIVGIDEVGRGPLAGAVYVGAVMMRYKDYCKVKWPGLTDSKKMTALARDAWYRRAKEMKTHGVLSIALTSRSVAMIDKKGINTCITKCIGSVLTKLTCNPRTTTVLLDGGLRAPEIYPSQQTIIRGDQSQKIISLASVIAKVTRDRYMATLAKKYPYYGWESNKGYGTKDHIIRLKKHGLTLEHRRTYLKRILDNLA